MAFFSSEVLTSKRGPLARVWLASTVGDRKLTKSQLLSTSIVKSIEAIVSAERQLTVDRSDEDDEDEQVVAAVPMALRLSGQLLLGVARIYSRKAKYLVDDCNDALLKIRMTFRIGASAMVDLAADQVRASKGAITRQETVNEFDLMYADLYDEWDDRPAPTTAAKTSKKVATAKDADITLPETDFDLIGNNYDAYAADLDFSGGLDSQVYLGDDTFDLGLDENVFENDVIETPSRAKRRRRDSTGAADDISVELGRDAPNSSARKSARLSDALQHDDDFDAAFATDLGAGADITFDDLPLGNDNFDFDLGFDRHPDDEQPLGSDIDGIRTPRAGSPSASLAPPSEVDVTPRTAARVNDQALQMSAAKKKAAGKPKQRKQIVDAVTELEASQSAAVSPVKRRAVAAGAGAESQPSQPQSQSLARSGPDGRADRVKMGLIVETPQYLPRSELHMRLLEIEQDPAAFYLPRVGDKQDQLYLGPPGLAPELQELFVIPIGGRRKRGQTSETGPANKRARGATEDDDRSVELGRRAPSLAPSAQHDQSGAGWDNLFDDAGALGANDSFQFDLDQAGGEIAPERTPTPFKNRPSIGFDRASSRLATPLPFKPSEGPLAIFDAVGPIPSSSGHYRSSQTPSQSQPMPSKAGLAGAEHGSGWSKNTLKAVQVITEQLGIQPEDVEEIEQEQQPACSFTDVSAKASRQAAAAFFFECLVLGTRDRVKLDQTDSYGEISIAPKPRFWELSSTTLAQSSPIAAR